MTHHDSSKRANERLQKAISKAAAKEAKLHKELRARRTEPEPGDLFRFPGTTKNLSMKVRLSNLASTLGPSSLNDMDYDFDSEYIDWRHVHPVWAILGQHAEVDEMWLAALADDVPLVGTPDLPIPTDALSGPLTIRCGMSHWIPSSIFCSGRRIGVLEPWHLKRAVEKMKEIFAFELIGSPGQSQVDADPDYQEWMRVADAHHTVMMDLVAEPTMEPVAREDTSGSEVLQGLLEYLRNAVCWELNIAAPGWAAGGIDNTGYVTLVDRKQREFRVWVETINLDGKPRAEVKVRQQFKPKQEMQIALEMTDGRLILPHSEDIRWWNSDELVVFDGFGNSRDVRGLRIVLRDD